MFGSTALRGAAACLAATFFCATAEAQLFRAYLASDGSDSNPCTLQQPCRLLPAALNAVANRGEIWMLDSGNYNTETVTIDKSVSILAIPGALGSVVAAPAAAGIQIDADGLVVYLRNLVIASLAKTPAVPGYEGVKMTGASLLTIENSLIENLYVEGISVTGAGVLKLINSTLRNNEGYAIRMENGAQADIRGAQILQKKGGIFVGGTIGITTVSVSDSIISGDDWSAPGVRAAPSTGGAARIAVTRSTITRSSTALDCLGATAAISISGNLIAHNVYPWSVAVNCAGIYTAGNNHFYNNSTSGTGALTPIVLQ